MNDSSVPDQPSVEPTKKPGGDTVAEPAADSAATQTYPPPVEAALDSSAETASPSDPLQTADYQPASSVAADATPTPPFVTTLVYESADNLGSHDPSAAGPADVLKCIAGYEILGELGRGAMGVVYKARQRGLKRLVALKMIRAGTHASEGEVARFRLEAEAVAALQHANIVQIYEVGEDAGQPFFSLEYIEGVSLAKRINGVPLPSHQAAELLLQMARGIGYAHQKGVIHRDLKPANVLIAKEGVAKITDFGLAKKLEDESGQTHSGTVLGTPSYMPPEQAEGKLDEIGPLSDVYSLGAVLYELLTGRPPFRGATILDTLHLVRTREPVAPTELNPKVGRDLETICLKCLRKDRTRRYASADALAEDVRRFLSGEPILARPVGAIERVWRWSRRNPMVAGLSAAVVLLLIVWAATSSILTVIAISKGEKAQKNEQEWFKAAALADAKATEALANAEMAKKMHGKRARMRRSPKKMSCKRAIDKSMLS